MDRGQDSSQRAEDSNMRPVAGRRRGAAGDGDKLDSRDAQAACQTQTLLARPSQQAQVQTSGSAAAPASQRKADKTQADLRARLQEFKKEKAKSSRDGAQTAREHTGSGDRIAAHWAPVSARKESARPISSIPAPSSRRQSSAIPSHASGRQTSRSRLVTAADCPPPTSTHAPTATPAVSRTAAARPSGKAGQHTAVHLARGPPSKPLSPMHTPAASSMAPGIPKLNLGSVHSVAGSPARSGSARSVPPPSGRSAPAGVSARLAGHSQVSEQHRRHSELQAAAMRLDLAKLQLERAQAENRTQTAEAEDMLQRAVGKVVQQQKAAIQQQVKLSNVSTALEAQAVLSQQLHALDKWAAIKDRQASSMSALEAALTSALTHVPVINGATCGPLLWECDQRGLVRELQLLQHSLSQLAQALPSRGLDSGCSAASPAVTQNDSAKNGALEDMGGAQIADCSALQDMASDVQQLVQAQADMHAHLQKNAQLLQAKEALTTQIQSLTLHLLSTAGSKPPLA